MQGLSLSVFFTMRNYIFFWRRSRCYNFRVIFFIPSISLLNGIRVKAVSFCSPVRIYMNGVIYKKGFLKEGFRILRKI